MSRYYIKCNSLTLYNKVVSVHIGTRKGTKARKDNEQPEIPISDFTLSF